MDNILIAGNQEDSLQEACSTLIKALQGRGFQISSEKIQMHPLQLFLGFELHPNSFNTESTN